MANSKLLAESLMEMSRLYDLHVIKQKLRLFEKKYAKSFEDFEKEVLEREDFEKWDDYLEWKAYIKTLRDLESVKENVSGKVPR